MNGYELAADIVVIAHFLYIAFVIVGLLLIALGLLMRWKWVRNFWFRLVHLSCIGIVVVQAWVSVECPLTTLENNLRARAGQQVYEVSFIAHWVRKIIFFQGEPWVFGLIYTIFGALVLSTWIFGRPTWPRRRRKDAAAATG